MQTHISKFIHSVMAGLVPAIHAAPHQTLSELEEAGRDPDSRRLLLSMV